MYAVPRFVLTAPVSKGKQREDAEEEGNPQVRFMGKSRSSMCPKEPKISRRWPSVTFFVSFSTTTWLCQHLGASSTSRVGDLPWYSVLGSHSWCDWKSGLRSGDGHGATLGDAIRVIATWERWCVVLGRESAKCALVRAKVSASLTASCVLLSW